MENIRKCKKIKKIKNAIKIGNLRHRIVTELFSILGYSNYNIAGLEIKNKVYKYVVRKYLKFLSKTDNTEAAMSESLINDNIWVCWLQGVDKAPILVKKCINSIYRHMPNKKIHIITSDNLEKYVNFPTYILKKWKDGIISDTEMSNFIRMELLVKYGGLWLDSTIFLTGPIPYWVYDSNIFMYTINDSEDITRKFNNYFIYAQKGDCFLRAILDIYYIYWKKENKVREYFLWHLIATMCKDSFREHFYDMFIIPDEIPHMLSNVIFDKFSQKYLDEICKITSIHKLSTKYILPDSIEETYYEKIIRDNLL